MLTALFSEDVPRTYFNLDHTFLDASTHLYMRVCPSVGLSVCLSVMRFFLITEIDKKQHRIIGKVETLSLDCNNLQKNLKTKFQNKISKQNFQKNFQNLKKKNKKNLKKFLFEIPWNGEIIEEIYIYIFFGGGGQKCMRGRH